MNTQKLLLYSAFIILASCASHHEPFSPVSPNALYQCDGAHQIMLSIRDQAEYAALSFAGRNLTLTRIKSPAADDVFSNDIFTLYYDQSKKSAVVEREGVPMFTGCTTDS